MARLAIVTAVLATGLITAPPAYAETCEAHLIRSHTTRDADIAYHSVHGGESPCKGTDDRQSHDNSSYDRKHHDDFGFHCTWRGCG